jgi:hypothetical protein
MDGAGLTCYELRGQRDTLEADAGDQGIELGLREGGDRRAAIGTSAWSMQLRSAGGLDTLEPASAPAPEPLRRRKAAVAAVLLLEMAPPGWATLAALEACSALPRRSQLLGESSATISALPRSRQGGLPGLLQPPCCR